MYQNGANTAERNKETPVQRLERFIHEFRRRAVREAENRMTGQICLTVNMKDGSFFQRHIASEDVGQ